MWIVQAESISTTSRDITFIAAPSRSDEFETGDAWDEHYRTYNVVQGGVVKNVRIAAGDDPSTGDVLTLKTSGDLWKIFPISVHNKLSCGIRKLLAS